MTRALHIDFETRATVELREQGVYIYAAHRHTDIWCMAYAFDDGPVHLWTPDFATPQEVLDHVVAGGELAAWNANFERVIWREILHKRWNWPNPKLEQFRCVMAEAYAMALPGQLGQAGPALGLDTQKDMAGHRLMLQMAKPRRIEPDGTPVWWDDAERRMRLYDYCRQDVATEREAEKRLLRLRPSEKCIYFLDQAINDRGVLVDTVLAERCGGIVRDTTSALDAEMNQITKGVVSRCSNATQIGAWLRGQGVDADSIAKAKLAELLARTDLADDVKRVLELRQEAAKASTAKIKAMLQRVDGGGRMRGNLQYHGAATGRWAGRGAQLQNLPRPTRKVGEEEVKALMSANSQLVDMMYGQPLSLVSEAIRAILTAAPGKTLMSADFANIEGRVLAWLAGQEDKLEAFRAYDAGKGPDLYLVAASGIFGDDVTDLTRRYAAKEREASDRRQIGKVAELALGYEGGVGAFVSMAKIYRVKVGDYFELIWKLAKAEHKENVVRAWETRGKRSGVEKRTWGAAEEVKVAGRATNPRIRGQGPLLNEAAIEAMQNPGAVIDRGKVRYRLNGSFLFCQLPSGRVLTYPYPRLEKKPLPWLRDDGSRPYADAIVYKGIDSVTKKWGDEDFYGGHAAENITQAVARDIMAEAMLRVEGAGYPVVFTVHDEIVSEPELGHGSLDEFKKLMTTLPRWAAGCPVAAEGWVGKRYRK